MFEVIKQVRAKVDAIRAERGQNAQRAPAASESSPNNQRAEYRTERPTLLGRIARALGANAGVQRFAAAVRNVGAALGAGASWIQERGSAAAEAVADGAEIFIEAMLAQAELDAAAAEGEQVSLDLEPAARKPGKRAAGLIAPELLLLEGALFGVSLAALAELESVAPLAEVRASLADSGVWQWASTDDAGSSVVARQGRMALQASGNAAESAQSLPSATESKASHAATQELSATANEAVVQHANVGASEDALAERYDDLDTDTVYDYRLTELEGPSSDESVADAGAIAIDPGETIDVIAHALRDTRADAGVAVAGIETPDFLGERSFAVTANSIMRVRGQGEMPESKPGVAGFDPFQEAVQEFSAHAAMHAAMGRAYQPPLQQLAFSSLLNNSSRGDRPLNNAIDLDKGFEGRGGGREDGQGHQQHQQPEPGVEDDSLASFA